MNVEYMILSLMRVVQLKTGIPLTDWSSGTHVCGMKIKRTGRHRQSNSTYNSGEFTVTVDDDSDFCLRYNVYIHRVQIDDQDPVEQCVSTEKMIRIDSCMYDNASVIYSTDRSRVLKRNVDLRKTEWPTDGNTFVYFLLFSLTGDLNVLRECFAATRLIYGEDSLKSVIWEKDMDYDE